MTIYMPEFARRHDDFFTASFFEDARDQIQNKKIDVDRFVISGKKKAEGLVAIVHMDLSIDFWKKIKDDPTVYVQLGQYPEMSVEESIRAISMPTSQNTQSDMMSTIAKTGAQIKLAQSLIQLGYNKSEISWHIKNPNKSLVTFYA